MKNRNRHNRTLPNGRSERATGRFVRLEHAILSTAAYRALTPNARALLIELAMLENGSNNGQIILSVSDATARIGLVDNKAAATAFEEVQNVGLVALAKDAHFQVKTGERRSREWRLTWLPIPGLSGATNEYQRWQPDSSTSVGKRQSKRADMGLRALSRFKKA
jgi:hypothetical protein